MRRVLALFVLLGCGAAGAACSGGQRAPDFALRDDGGNLWRLSQHRGTALLLTFGFTHCADTCPAMLARLVHVTSSLHARAKEVEIVFVTIDPGRDSTAVMHRFIKRFVRSGASRLIGLTGKPGEIDTVKRAYHIWSQRSSSDIAHTAVVFLIDAQGRVRAIRDAQDSQASLRQAVEEFLG